MVNVKKFTKKAFRAAIKENNQTKVWHLAAIKLGRTPKKNEVCDLVDELATSERDHKKAYDLAYNSQRKIRLVAAETRAFYKRGAYRQYNTSYYREIALKMLRRLAIEPITNYTKVPMFGMNHLYFCSPAYGHEDYNKVRTCLLNGPLVRDAKGNLFDTQSVWCKKIVNIGERIYARKAG